MTVYTVHQAKTQLSKLLARVENGEKVLIARGNNKPVARLVAFASLPPDDLAAWSGDE